jgi:hypothetical protein
MNPGKLPTETGAQYRERMAALDAEQASAIAALGGELNAKTQLIHCPQCNCAGGNEVDRENGVTLQCQYCGYRRYSSRSLQSVPMATATTFGGELPPEQPPAYRDLTPTTPAPDGWLAKLKALIFGGGW